MRLAEFLELRAAPGAGVALVLTGRCPLRCAHCSTDSTPLAAEPPAAALRTFAESFATAPRPPAVALFTGGEPLLRPRLVGELAARCRAAGTAAFLLTGLYFARTHPVPPPPVAAALAAVDHVSVSMDPFHEREVPRAAVFAALHRLLAAGQDVSVHLLASGPADPYPDTAAAAVRAEFGDRVPMLVGRLAPVGRARDLLSAAVVAPPATAADPTWAEAVAGGRPCAMAAWPVVGTDGAVTACCNQDVVDAPDAAAHLRLGTAPADDWARIRERTLRSPALRVVRTLGVTSCAGCRALRGAPDLRLARTAGALEQAVAELHARAGAVGFARRYGSPRHTELVLLGTREESPPCAAG